MILPRGEIARITGLELARTAVFLAVISLVVAIGMRWCMPVVLKVLAARFALPEVPDWPDVLWLFLGVPWLVFFLVAISVKVIEIGFWSWLTLAGPVWGYGIACLVLTLSVPLRIRERILRAFGTALVTAALDGAVVNGSRESLEEIVHARLAQLGLRSYALRRMIARATADAAARDRQPVTIVQTCLDELRRRQRRIKVIAAVALLCSGAAIVMLGLGAYRLWPSPTPCGPAGEC